MPTPEQLFANNRLWADRTKKADPDFFLKLSRQQAPKYLWIGCADSRVPANEIVGLMPGELFVHRNVANIVVHSDLNCLSVLQYAVEVLQVEHVIICGHYGCGGVQHAMSHGHLGLIDNWLRSIKDVYQNNLELMEALSEPERLDRLCELNVAQQVANICHTTIVQQAWFAGQSLSVHGFIYSIKDGLLHDLDVSVSSLAQIPPIYRVG